MFRFGVQIHPPAKNSRYTGEDEGIMQLNFLKTFIILG